MTTKEELFRQVADAVHAVLNTKEGEIGMESMFLADLGTESIDFLDISFEVEKRTGVELDFPSVMKYVIEKKGNEVTDLSVSELVEYLYYVKTK